MLLEASDSQLVLVDYQERLMAALPEREPVLANARRLAQAARCLRVPVWGTEQNPAKLGPNDPGLRDLCQRTLAKMHFSAVPDGLLECLRPATKGGNARSLRGIDAVQRILISETGDDGSDTAMVLGDNLRMGLLEAVGVILANTQEMLEQAHDNAKAASGAVRNLR